MGCCSSVPRENKSLKNTESTSNKYSQIPNELKTEEEYKSDRLPETKDQEEKTYHNDKKFIRIRNDIGLLHHQKSCELNTINEHMFADKDFVSIISNTTDIINNLNNELVRMESFLDIYCGSKNEWITFGAILSKYNLYLIPFIYYDIWTEFIYRTKINEIMKNSTDKIDNYIASQLTNNLIQGIKCNFTIKSKIKKRLIKRSKYNLKTEILFNTNNTETLTLAGMLGLNGNDIGNKRYILVKEYYNSEILPEVLRDQFIDYVFKHRIYTEKRKINYDLLLVLRHYINDEIIENMNERREEFFEEKNLSNAELLVVTNLKTPKKESDLCVFNISIECCQNIKPLYLSKNKSFGFELNSRKNSMQCKLSSNNLLFEWITHIDYVINHWKSQIQCEEKDYIPLKSMVENDNINGNINSSKVNKLIHDFTNNKHNKNGNVQFVTHFGFGEEVFYWQDGYENSCKPVYSTLKEELLNNKYAKLSIEQYYNLYEKCYDLLKKCKYKINGNIQNTFITVNHIMAVKVFMDNDNIRKCFQKCCLKNSNKEIIGKFMARHNEIGNWAKYVKECCKIYCKWMKEGNDNELYTVINRYLLFNTLTLDIQCPMIATTNFDYAKSIASDNVNCIILKLNAANDNTTYFDCSFVNEKIYYRNNKLNEVIIFGSNIEISDIIINGKTMREYISGLLLFERIINGQFIRDYENELVQNELYNLMAYHMKILKDKKFKMPKYIKTIWENMIHLMVIHSYGKDIWINKSQITNITNEKLKCLLYDYTNDTIGEFFNFVKVENKCIQWVQSFDWIINGNICKKLKSKQTINSSEYVCSTEKKENMTFNLKCSQSIDNPNKCALYLCVHKLPSHLQSIEIKYEIYCKELQYISAAEMTLNNKETDHYIGDTFDYKKLIENERISTITLNIAIKVISVELIETIETTDGSDIIAYLSKSDNAEEKLLLKLFESLHTKNKELEMEQEHNKTQLQQKENELNRIKAERDQLKKRVHHRKKSPRRLYRHMSPTFSRKYGSALSFSFSERIIDNICDNIDENAMSPISKINENAELK